MAVVTATPTFHPLRQLEQLTSELKAMAFEGSVLFDLMAVNGLAENRFASMTFGQAGFERTTFLVETDVDPYILSEQDLIARRDQSFLAGSVLSSSEIRKFTHQTSSGGIGL